MAVLYQQIHVLAVVLLVVILAPAAMASSLSSFWQDHLPQTSMPPAFEKLASPLSPSRARQYAAKLQAGTLQASRDAEFCSSAEIYCQEDAIDGVQPRVCIEQFFDYAYNILPCNPESAAESAVIAAKAANTFFSPDSLSVGAAVQLPDTSNDLKGRRFLPYSLAEAMPELTMSSLSELEKIYGVAEGSNMGLDMQETAALCSFKSEHEVKACVTAGEAMVSFVAETVGRDATAIAPPAMAMQKATVEGVSVVNVKGSKVASCHDMSFPSLLFSCHTMQSSQVMDVSLKLADGTTAHMPAVCHMDTSYWNPSHVAFHVLNTQPGASAICHWFPENSFIFVEGAS